jgi:fumarylpyruvate hydrolase
MAYVFTPEAIPAVPVAGTAAKFPVRRIYCVGQNYSDHVKEMGGDPKQNSPVFFSKPANAVVLDNQPVAYPQATDNLHYEVELVVALGAGGKAIDVADALNCVFGYAVGIDFTRRDLQAAAKQKGRPWDTAKGFDQSAPISAIVPVADVAHPEQARIRLAVNGDARQDASTAAMIWSVPEIISELSNYYELQAGDLIFTGTPSGVSAVNVGDQLLASIDGIGELRVELV